MGFRAERRSAFVVFPRPEEQFGQPSVLVEVSRERAAHALEQIPDPGVSAARVAGQRIDADALRPDELGREVPANRGPRFGPRTARVPVRIKLERQKPILV